MNADLPRDGWRHDLGVATFNFTDTATTCGETHPATLREKAVALYYTPFTRIINPQKPDGPGDLWEPGFARTVRFQFSLSGAAPSVARYVAPAWWYAACGEPWAGGFLPVDGRFTPMAVTTADHVRKIMRRGAFDGGSEHNFGHAGAGLMQQAHLTGDAGLYQDAVDNCTYWADLAVDHTDFTVRQWLGGWGWKTCAYNKFRDVLFIWLETGDPWMRDTMELAAEAYWGWFRSNWPRNTIGRDAFEVGTWALLWRYLQTEHARSRLHEMVRMIRGVLESRGEIGGQMGAGPHPGWHSSLYMTGVVMASLVEALEAEEEAGGDKDALLALLCALHAHFMRDDVELWPVALGRSPRASWKPCDVAAFSVFALRIYPAMGRWFGFSHPAVREGFAKLRPWLDADVESPDNWGRLSEQHVHPRAHDALMLGARVAADGQGVDLAPAFGPATLPWPVTQTVATPWGALSIAVLETADRVILNFDAPADFRVRVEAGTGATETRSHGGIQISKNPCD